MRSFPNSVAAAAACALLNGPAWAQSETPDALSSYLVDVGSGSVSAAGLVGVSGSAITNLQSSQDLILAVAPFSSDSSRSGYGLAITPARTSILPMSGATYVGNPLIRIVGAATLSYGENTSTLSGSSYRRIAASLDTTYYLDREDDPIFIGYGAFTSDRCRKAREEPQKRAIDAAEKRDTDTFNKEMEETTAADRKCVNDTLKSRARWNAGKLSLAYGAGWIRPDSAAGTQLSLGRTLAASGMFGVGRDSAANVTLRRTVSEVDLTTLTGTPVFKDSGLAAIRFTNGSAGDGDLFWLAEASSASSTTVTVSNNAFKYAVGIDKRIYQGVWLEFRLGRNRTLEGTSNQTASLLALKWAPTSSLGK